MTAEVTLNGILTGSAAVVAAVGDRIYPLVVPDGKELPAIAYQRTSTEYIPVIHGSRPVAGKVTIDIYCVDASNAGSKSLCDLILAIDIPVDTDMLVTNRSDLFDADTGLYATVLSVNVWENQS